MADPTGMYENQFLYLGGLVGILSPDGSINRCYAAGAVGSGRQPEENWLFGGLVGLKERREKNNNGVVEILKEGDVVSSYYNKEANEKGVGGITGEGEVSEEGLVGKTEAELRNPDTFEDWDLDGNPWVIREGETAPSFPWQKEEDLPLQKPYEEVIYHTVHLTLGGEINCDYEEGQLVVADGDFLYLQFYADDSAVTAEDILLLVDDVETAFREMNDNRFIYILNSIKHDTEVVIALREYSVVLPSVDGVVSEPAAGEHWVAYGQPFTFTLTSVEGNSLEEARVCVNGTELPHDPLRSMRKSYTIDNLEEHITVVVKGIKQEDVTGNVGITESKVRLAVENGELRMENAGEQAVDVAVYSITGRSVIQVPALRGVHSTSLPSGIYLVRAGETTTKVIVK